MLNKNYGIGAQALAVQAYLNMFDGVEASWDKERKCYLAEPKVAPWYNGRERGIVVYMVDQQWQRQINIAIYEHRNTDQICALMFEAKTYGNPPTLADVPPGVYETKGDFTECWRYNEAYDAAEWVYEQLENFWVEAKEVVDQSA